MLEMDRFVHELNGDREEVIVRRSSQSAATMKEKGFTVLQ